MPRLFFHVDINSCYVSCERILNPALRDVPVVVLSNNDGCIVALDGLAKAQGMVMGDPWFKVSQIAEARGIVACSSNYELYGDISNRVMSVLQEYAEDFEQYSVDEAFLRVTMYPKDAHNLAQQIKTALWKRVGVPVCVGVASTKTLAKLANKTAKKIPALGGICVWDCLPEARRTALFDTLPVSEVWGIGGRTTKKLAAMGITNINQLVATPHAVIRKRFTVVLMRTVLELRGQSTIKLETERKTKEQLIYSRSFSTPIDGRDKMQQVLSIYAQRASAPLTHHGLVVGSLSAFCGTSYYTAVGMQHFPRINARISIPTADPVVLTKAANLLLGQTDFAVARYARAGIMLNDLTPVGWHQPLEPFVYAYEDKNIAVLLQEGQEHCGEGSIGLGFAGLKRPVDWEMNRGMPSKRGTTRWKELQVAKL